MSEPCVQTGQNGRKSAHGGLKMRFCWTPDTLRAARRLYLEQGFSAAESARRLGVSRSALIGKAHRMGWAAERNPDLAVANHVRGGRAVARALRPALPPRAAPPKPGATPAGCNPKPWLDRLAGECAFPVEGDGEAVISCCAPSGGQVYCQAHVAVLYVQRTEAQQKALERIAEWVDRLERPVRKPVAVR